MDCESDFSDAMAKVGIIANDPIIRDFKLHLVDLDEDEPGCEIGFYSLYPGDEPSGIFGCLARGILCVWWPELGLKSFEPRGGIRNAMIRLIESELTQLELIRQAEKELGKELKASNVDTTEPEPEFLTFKEIKDRIPDIDPSYLDCLVRAGHVECIRSGRGHPRMYPQDALRLIEYYHKRKWFIEYELL